MAFEGWPVEAIEFFDRLEGDNTKVFWTEHKQVYEECVKAPMVELLAELERRYGAGKVFRPYRDVRFSKDKTSHSLDKAMLTDFYLHFDHTRATAQSNNQ